MSLEGGTQVLSYVIDLADLASPGLRAFRDQVALTTKTTQDSFKALQASAAQTTSAIGKLAEAEKAGASSGTAFAASQSKSAASTKATAGELAALSSSHTRVTTASKLTTAAHAEHANALTTLSGKLGTAGSKTREAGSALSSLSMPILAVGAASLYASSKFGGFMEQLHTQAGYTQAQVDKLSNSVIKLSPQLAQTPDAIAQGLYHIASIGIPASKAIDVVTASAKGANISGANFNDTANTLATTLHNWPNIVGGASGAMGILDGIVGKGNLHMEDLVTNLGKVVPVAKAVGVTLPELGSAIDVLTKGGLGASQATTSLRFGLSLIEKPSSTANAALAQLGLTNIEMATDLHKPDGLLVALSDLKSHLETAFPPNATAAQKTQELRTYAAELKATGASAATYKTDLGKFYSELASGAPSSVLQSQATLSIFGGTRGSTAILPLLQNLPELQKIYTEIPQGKTAVDQLNASVAAWDKTQQGQLDHLRAGIEAVGVTFGKDIGPVVLPVLKDVVGDIGSVVTAFGHLSPTEQHVIEGFLGLGIVAGPLLKITGNVLKLGSAVTSVAGWVGSKLIAAFGGAPAAIAPAVAETDAAVTGIGVTTTEAATVVGTATTDMGVSFAYPGGAIATLDAEIVGIGTTATEVAATVDTETVAMGGSFVALGATATTALGRIVAFAGPLAGVLAMSGAVGKNAAGQGGSATTGIFSSNAEASAFFHSAAGQKFYPNTAQEKAAQVAFNAQWVKSHPHAGGGLVPGAGTVGGINQSMLGGAGGGGTQGSPLALIAYLRTQGFTANAAAGIAGNIGGAEDTNWSGATLQGGQQGTLAQAQARGIGFGLAQWTDPGRQAGLAALAAKMGLSPSDAKVQYAYIAQELSANPALKAQLNMASSPAAAAQIAALQYEAPAPATANYAGRQAAATAYGGGSLAGAYNSLIGSAAPPAATSMHFDWQTGQYEIMTAAKYKALQDAWNKLHPTIAMPTSAAALTRALASTGPAISAGYAAGTRQFATANSLSTANAISGGFTTGVKQAGAQLLAGAQAATGADAGTIDRNALIGLQALIATARKTGSTSLIVGFRKDMETVTKSWDAAIQTNFQSNLTGVGLAEQLRINMQQLGISPTAKATVGKHGSISFGKVTASPNPAATSATDPAYLAAQIAAYAGYDSQLVAEQTADTKILAAAKKAHNTALVASTKSDLQSISNALLQSKVDVSGLKVAYAQAVYQAFLTGIQNTAAALDQSSQNQGTLAGAAASLADASGTGLNALQALSGQQGGLTGAQIGQANSDLAQFIQGVMNQEAPISGPQTGASLNQTLPGIISALQRGGQSSGDYSALSAFFGSGNSELGVDFGALASGQLSATDQSAMLNAIINLISTLAGLQSSVATQVTATNTLTGATLTNTATMASFGGQVTFTLPNDQSGTSYVAGMSSVNTSYLGVGV